MRVTCASSTAGVLSWRRSASDEQLVVRHRVPQEVTQARGQLDVRNPVHSRRIVRVEVALDVEQEMRRDEHRLNGEGNALLDRLAVVLREGDELAQRRDLRGGHRPAVGAPRHRRQDAIDTLRTGRGIAHQDLLAARLLPLRGKRANDRHRADPLVEGVLVDVRRGERLDERVVDESEAERVIAFGDRDADLLFRVRVEVDEARRLGFDLLRVRQLAIHPEAQRDGRGILRALPGQSDLELVVGVEIETVRRLDVARIEPAQILEAQAVLRLQSASAAARRRSPARRSARRRTGISPSARATRSGRRRCCRTRRPNRRSGSSCRRGTRSRGDRGSCSCTRPGSAAAR